jgi:hypothetical protein
METHDYFGPLVDLLATGEVGIGEFFETLDRTALLKEAPEGRGGHFANGHPQINGMTER